MPGRIGSVRLLLISALLLGAPMPARSRARADERPATSNLAKSPAAPIYATKGIVTFAADNRPAANVEVLACHRNGEIVKKVRTNGAGEFQIPAEWWQCEDAHVIGGDPAVILLVQHASGLIGWADLERVRQLHEQKARAAAGDASNGDAPGSKAMAPVKIALLLRTGLVEAQLVDEAGKPLQGIRLELSHLNNPINGSLTPHHHRIGIPVEFASFNVVTDAEGVFRFQFPNDSSGEVISVSPDWIPRSIRFKCSADGTIVEVARYGRIDGQPRVQVELVDDGRIALERAGRIEGRVTHAVTRKPIKSAHIRAAQLGLAGVNYGQHADAMTNTDGVFLLGALYPGAYDLFADVPADGRLVSPLVDPVVVSLEKAAHVDLAMFPGKRLHGRVVEAANGRPVSGTRVNAMVSHRPDAATRFAKSGKTNEKGEFELFVPPGICTVHTPPTMERQPHSDQERTIEMGENTEPAFIVLKIGAPITNQLIGVVPKEAAKKAVIVKAKELAEPETAPVRHKLDVELHTDSKKPIGGHVVRLIYSGKSHWTESSYREDAKFIQMFREEESGKVGILLIDVPGFRPVRSEEFTVGPEMPPLVIDLEPATYAPIRGIVEADDGKSLKGARVRMRRIIYGTEMKFPSGLETSVDESGRFELKHVRVGEQVIVVVEHDGYTKDESAPILIEDEEPVELPTMTLKSR